MSPRINVQSEPKHPRDGRQSQGDGQVPLDLSHAQSPHDGLDSAGGGRRGRRADRLARVRAGWGAEVRHAEANKGRILDK